MNAAPKRTITSWVTFICLLGLVTGGGFTAGVVAGLVLVTEHETVIQQYLGDLINFEDASEGGATPLPIPARTE